MISSPPEFPPAASSIYRGRFAPSPTGPLHLGSLFTALASFLQARSVGGQWHVRIDDVDRTRTVPGASDDILRCLDSFGLEWDGPVTFQSREEAVYQAAIDALSDQGLIFRCACSRSDIARNSANPAIYPGTCRHSTVSERQSHALRIRVPDEVITVADHLQGAFEQDLACSVGDFVIKRRDQLFAYHLATVIDDAALGVTDVMRGVDLLDSTPRQIYLQRCLDLAMPRYAHLPVLVDAAGNKLSKQTGATAVQGKDASSALLRLLSLMRHEVPANLIGAGVPELLTWAIAHWDASRLAGIATIPAGPS